MRPINGAHYCREPTKFIKVKLCSLKLLSNRPAYLMPKVVVDSLYSLPQKSRASIFPTTNISLQTYKLAPCVNLNKVTATLTSTGIAKRYLVSYFYTWDFSKLLKEDTTGFDIQNIWNQYSSPYWSRRKRLNHVVLWGFIQNPKSSSNNVNKLQILNVWRATALILYTSEIDP